MIKKIITLTLYLSLFLHTNLTSAINITINNATEWKLITETDGIKVFERWITNNKAKVKERTGKMTINCSINDVIALIKNIKKTPLWIKDAEKVENIKTEDSNTWYVHTILDTPWPFNKQDMVSKYKIVENSNENEAKILITQDKKLLPPIKGIDRLDSFYATWEIYAIKNNKVKVIFTTTSTKPPKYPSWAQDPVVRRVFINNLRNFKKLLNN